jgi:NTP pyrophosphatase (non-canonical NTP hydrolase)
MYYIYHIPGKKIGVTTNPKIRVEKIQGYKKNEYEILLETNDINLVSEKEIELQKQYQYRIDKTLYKNVRKNRMKINTTEQTTTFPVSINNLEEYLKTHEDHTWYSKDNIEYKLNTETINWLLTNAKKSQFTDNRCFVYNKALKEWYKTSNTMKNKAIKNIEVKDYDVVPAHRDLFALIRNWAKEKGIYEKGDPKTQLVKLVEEVGELSKALLENDEHEIQDAIGDIVVVLTNLARLKNYYIEDCIAQAYNEIKNRKGKIINGTFIKDENKN